MPEKHQSVGIVRLCALLQRFLPCSSSAPLAMSSGATQLAASTAQTVVSFFYAETVGEWPDTASIHLLFFFVTFRHKTPAVLVLRIYTVLVSFHFRLHCGLSRRLPSVAHLAIYSIRSHRIANPYSYQRITTAANHRSLSQGRITITG